ncbi:MAG: hypothetical protein VW339_07360 [Quisquiliibacterium sp.]
MKLSRWYGRFRGWAVAAGALLLSGCAPDFNWREVHGPKGDYRVMFPSKPASMTRDIQLGDLPVPMTMQGARVNEIRFTVAVATLPDADPGTRQKALAWMRAGMLRNIAAKDEKTASSLVTLIDAQGVARGRAPAIQIDARGSINGKPARMLAGFAALGSSAYQWVVIGPSLPEEQARIFIDSFRLVPVPASQAGALGSPSKAVRQAPANDPVPGKGSSN